MNHTPETLLALTKSPDGLEQLRIIAAYADEGWFQPESMRHYPSSKTWHKRGHGDKYFCGSGIPEYTTSLDAIFAAEDRLRIHDVHSRLNSEWKKHLTRVSEITDIGFLSFTPPLRLIIFILTAQWKEQNK